MRLACSIWTSFVYADCISSHACFKYALHYTPCQPAIMDKVQHCGHQLMGSIKCQLTSHLLKPGERSF